MSTLDRRRLSLLLDGLCIAAHASTTTCRAYSRWPSGPQAGDLRVRAAAVAAGAAPAAAAARGCAPGRRSKAPGFTPAADPKHADVTVQVGARITATDRSPFDDPFWWGPGVRTGLRPLPPGARATGGRAASTAGWGRPSTLRLRARGGAADPRPAQPASRSTKPRAAATGSTPMADTTLPAMFEAALQGLSGTAPRSNPHRVTVDLGAAEPSRRVRRLSAASRSSARRSADPAAQPALRGTARCVGATALCSSAKMRQL